MSCTSLPWTSTPAKLGASSILHSRRKKMENDSAFIDDLRDNSDSCPDYEEVTEGFVYNIAEAEGGFYTDSNDGSNQSRSHNSLISTNDPVTRNKIMNSTIYCIHKVIYCIII